MLNITDEIASKLASTLDPDIVTECVEKALEKKINPLQIIEKGLSKGLREIGEKYEKGELFIMHLVAASEAVKKPMTELLLPKIQETRLERKVLGRVVIGTVAGDIHDIGKNIVSAMLTVAGFDVYDIGKDAQIEEFIEKINEVDADIVGASALLSTTLPLQRELVERLKSADMRDRVKVIVGGAPVTEEWAEEIGADGYGSDALDAVELAKNLMGG